VADAAEVLGEIRRIVRQELGCQREVGPETELLAHLQLDSLQLLTLVVGLEDRFEVALGEGDAEKVRTAGELAALVAGRGQVAPPPAAESAPC
jgi:acyl carrier protein